jgi:outer membrane protein OmpA-like peptidoglycan-associated protein
MTRLAVIALLLGLAVPLLADELPGATDHPMVTRYPGQELRWQTIDNYREYRIPVGPVSGYRAIDDWIDTQGRVTRSFYVYPGTDRSWSEVYLNYRTAFEEQGFELLAEGSSDDRRGTAVGSRQWLEIYLRSNPLTAPGEVNSMAAGTSTSGGQGVFVARIDRAAGPAYVVVTVEQHAVDYVGTLVDIVEVERAQTGLVAVDAEAIGRDLADKGRVVLDGIYFDYDSATLQARSGEALEAMAAYLRAHDAQRFYVVGHTDSRGGFGYNRELSQRRAQAVVDALVTAHGIARDRLEAHGVGPLVPVFSNASDDGRERNRRVELVERLESNDS